MAGRIEIVAFIDCFTETDSQHLEPDRWNSQTCGYTE
jgi:hypothetical protein